jgi:hypothetical protein
MRPERSRPAGARHGKGQSLRDERQAAGPSPPERNGQRIVTGGIPPLSISSDDLRALLRQPESTTLEFRDALGSPQAIQRLVAAFANTEGGTLVIGQHPESGRFPGLAHPGVALWHIEKWVKEVSPQPDVRGAIVELETAQHFLVVRVARGDQVPYLAESQAFERRGNRVAALTAERLFAALPRQPAEIQVRQIAYAIVQQSAKIDSLSKRMHWKRQLPIRIVAALIGAVVGAVVGYVLGVWNPL